MTFNELFKIILTGDKDQSREAARRVRKFLYSSQSDGKNEYKQIKNIIKTAPNAYVKISEGWRQENFAMAVSVIYYLHDRENNPDFLFPWLFQLLQHENGNIRQASVRMIQNELGPLTYYIRFPGRKSDFHQLSPEKSDQILSELRVNLNNLAVSSWKDSYKKFKYINHLPSGTYKSVQLILSVLGEYCNDVADDQLRVETKEQILSRRKEIEQEIVDIFKETDPTSPPPSRKASDGQGRLRRGKEQFTLQDVKDAIYNEEDNDDMMKVVAMFDRGDASELSNVLELVTDAWNYFPHKILGGISPAEKLLEYKRTSVNDESR
ncbi:hypothetical protein C4572_00570 [Candidatus Parcubacteria bacterium]|nr:MAG: hypothetical protein C4572_00570 [Candidatus Parcubacteria bacterium]